MGGRGGGKGGGGGSATATQASPSSGAGPIGVYTAPDGTRVETRIDTIVNWESASGRKNFVTFAISQDGSQVLGDVEATFSAKDKWVQINISKVYGERQGIGTKLYESIITQARSMGATRLVSDTIVSTKAAGLWTSKLIPKYGGGKSSDAYRIGDNYTTRGVSPVFEIKIK